MIKTKFISLVFSFLLIAINAFSQAGSYYNSISTSSASFVNDLKSRIRSPYTRISYDNFDETNIANFASIDNGNGTRSVFCVYSGYEYIYSGTFTWAVMSREHTWAQSWMPTYPSTSNDQYSDQHNLFPTHNNNANNRRSNHPFGIVTTVTYQFLDGKLGTNSLGQIVYEPRNSDKGDAVRALLYDCIKYDGVSGYTWNFNWLNGTRLPSLSEDSQSVALILDWNRQDPPDKWEVDRNNYIQSIQQNRNPFSDHPEYTSYINFYDLTKLNPVFAAEPTNYPSAFSSSVSENNITINWNDATGSQLPSGYLLLAYSKNNYFIPIDGSVYSNDTNLADGVALLNIDYNSPNVYSFNNLNPNVTYYFTIYSYNGSGTQINYKTDGTFPQTNSFIPPSLAAEPTNHVTNFAAGNITTTSFQVSWTDAVPGIQAPSGYLILANTSNIFTNPSDGTTYPNDTNLADGSASVNIAYNAADNYTFNNLLTNTNYYLKIYTYNGNGSQINYKTDGTIPYVSAATLNFSYFFSTSLLDNFNRDNNNLLGYTLLPEKVTWLETETAAPASLSVSSNRIKAGSIIAGREFAYINLSQVNGYPIQLNLSSSVLTWAFNIRQSRADPSGFDNNNYGIAYVLGKSTSDVTSGNGYAVVLGQSGSTDAIRLAKFTGGVNANSKFTNVVSGGDYANQYLSIKVIFDPSGNNWSLYVDSSSAGFPQSDPRNTVTQIGTASDNSYTSSTLLYSGALWNHATGASDSAVFDDIIIPHTAITTLNLTAIIEGFYNTTTNKLNIKDTVSVILRNQLNPYVIVDTSISEIDSVNFTGNFNFFALPTGNYFIEIKHRNCIETWSKIPVNFVAGTTFSYNFTDSASKAYGDNMILKNGKYCLYSGDVNQDGIVDASDLSDIDNDATNFSSGYLNTDLNGDLIIDASDGAIAENNASEYISVITP